MKFNKYLKLMSAVFLGAMLFAGQIFAQKTSTPKAKASATAQIGGTNPAEKTAKSSISTNAAASKIKQIDVDGLKKVLTPNGKPLLVNFWATWCDPCRDEFPDLVKISGDYQGKIDVAVVSLDDLAEINRDVPAFLKEMKAEMPAYLLKVPDEDAAISTVSKDWQGGLPFSILYGADGKIVYTKMGKVEPLILRQAIDKLLVSPLSEPKTGVIK